MQHLNATFECNNDFTINHFMNNFLFLFQHFLVFSFLFSFFMFLAFSSFVTFSQWPIVFSIIFLPPFLTFVALLPFEFIASFQMSQPKVNVLFCAWTLAMVDLTILKHFQLDLRFLLLFF